MTSDVYRYLPSTVPCSVYMTSDVYRYLPSAVPCIVYMTSDVYRYLPSAVPCISINLLPRKLAAYLDILAAWKQRYKSILLFPTPIYINCFGRIP